MSLTEDAPCVVVDVNELDALIERAAKQGFMWHQFRADRNGPEVLAGVYRWPTCTDVVVLTDEKGSHAYRTPTDPEIDVFEPTHVYWWYGRADHVVTSAAGKTLPGVSMVWVVRAVLTLPRPDEPSGLLPLMAAPAGTGVPGNRVPVTVRSWLGR